MNIYDMIKQVFKPPRIWFFHPPGDSMVSESAKPKAAHATTFKDDGRMGGWEMMFPQKMAEASI